MLKLMFQLFISLLALFISRPVFAVDVISYSQATKSGLINQRIDVDYGEKLFANRRFYAPLLAIDSLLPKGRAKTTTTKGFNKTIIKDILYTTAAVASQTTGQEGNELTLTLAAGDKNNVIVNQIIQLGITPTDDATYTNEVIVTDKTAVATTIKVKATNTDLLIGIESGTNIPASTMLNCMATRFNQNSKSVEPVGFEPTPFENYVQEVRWPYEYSMIAAKENLYKGSFTTKDGSLRAEKDREAKEYILAFTDKSILMQGAGIREKSSESSEVDFGQMRGLIHWIKEEGSPASMGYARNAWINDDFDNWCYELGHPDLEEKPRLVLTNRAGKSMLSKRKTNHPAWTWEKVPIDVFGIPGVNTYVDDYVEFQVKVHPAIDRVYNQKDQPFFLAITPEMFEIKYMTDWMLRANIQDPDKTGYKSEYYAALTSRLYNAHTAYHGVLYPY